MIYNDVVLWVVKLFRSWPGVIMTVFNTSATVVFFCVKFRQNVKNKKKSSNLEIFFSTTFVLVPATGTFQVCNELFYGLDQL
jgi:hypothetical protein